MSQALRYVLETRSHAEEVMASKALTVCWMGTDTRTRKISRGGQVWQRTSAEEIAAAPRRHLYIPAHSSQHLHRAGHTEDAP